MFEWMDGWAEFLHFPPALIDVVRFLNDRYIQTESDKDLHKKDQDAHDNEEEVVCVLWKDFKVQLPLFLPFFPNLQIDHLVLQFLTSGHFEAFKHDSLKLSDSDFHSFKIVIYTKCSHQEANFGIDY